MPVRYGASSRRRVGFGLAYTFDWKREPVAYWAHVPVDADANFYDPDVAVMPPAPQPHGRLGWPVVCVPVGAHVLRFGSRAQLAEVIAVLSQKPLPSTRRLSALRHAACGGAAWQYGPNGHWLSRLPVELKRTQARARLVQRLQAVLDSADLPF